MLCRLSRRQVEYECIDVVAKDTELYEQENLESADVNALAPEPGGGLLVTKVSPAKAQMMHRGRRVALSALCWKPKAMQYA